YTIELKRATNLIGASHFILSVPHQTWLERSRGVLFAKTLTRGRLTAEILDHRSHINRSAGADAKVMGALLEVAAHSPDGEEYPGLGGLGDHLGSLLPSSRRHWSGFGERNRAEKRRTMQGTRTTSSTSPTDNNPGNRKF
ncbi:unnamed protein product, partial [Ixodes pacificus]